MWYIQYTRFKMSNKQKKDSISIRIPHDYYEKLKELATNNKRPLVAELTIILDDYLKPSTELASVRKLKTLSRITGIIKNLPRKHYGRTVDEELYGD